MKRILFSLVALAFLIGPANASRFWVGGTGTWDGVTTTHWSTSSGGTGGASVPSTNDDVIFDANSGGGTVTVNTNPTIDSLTLGGFTGTLDFSVNNNNVTINATVTFNGLNVSGTGIRTFNMGNGTWTISSASGTIINFGTTTNLTFNANSSTIVISNNTPTNIRTAALGGKTFNAITVNTSGTSKFARLQIDNGTIGTYTINGQNNIYFGNNLTVTGAFTVNGTAYNSNVVMFTLDGSFKTITLTGAAVSISWAAIGGLTFTGTGITANNSFDMGGNSGITINGPSGGSGGRIIGG